jgi:hypothetical protein
MKGAYFQDASKLFEIVPEALFASSLSIDSRVHGYLHMLTVCPTTFPVM